MALRQAGAFKRKAETASHLQKWSLDRLERTIQGLSGAIADVRRDARLSRERTARVFLSIAQAAKRPGA
jgi:uncharacterized protein (DUF2236 family)